MPKVRIHQLAKELNMPNEKIIELLAKRGITVKGPFEALDEATVEHLRKVVRRDGEKAKARLEAKPEIKAPRATKAAAKPQEAVAATVTEVKEVPPEEQEDR